MRILLSNACMSLRRGTELYTSELALYLSQQGHEVQVYSPIGGALAQELRTQGVPVVEGVQQLDFEPEVIHAQHNTTAYALAALYPAVPIVYACHGMVPLSELVPPQIPQIQSYVAVSQPIAEKLELEAGIPREKIHIVPNFVDINRFHSRSSFRTKPRRALCFSNYLSASVGYPIVRRAMSSLGIATDLVGISAGNCIEEPESILADYDIVFARGRAALEAMATGAGVVLCDIEGMGSLVETSNFERLRALNFGAASFTSEISEAKLVEEVLRFDQDDVRSVSERVRNECTLASAGGKLVELYRASSFSSSDSSFDSKKTASFLEWFAGAREIEASQQIEKWKSLYEANQAELNSIKASRMWPALKLGSRFKRKILPKGSLSTKSLSFALERGKRTFQTKNETRPTLTDEFLSGLQGKPPQLACVVMSYRDESWVVSAVQSLLHQSVPIEIVVVNSGKTGTEERLKSHGINVLVVETDKRLLPGAARNLGIAATSAPYVSFLAADCLAEADWAAYRLLAHSQGSLAVSGSITNPYGSSLAAWASYLSLYTNRLPRTTESEAKHYSVSYARWLFEKYGLFDETLRAGEDTAFNNSLKVSVDFTWNPEVRTAHRHPATLREFFRDMSYRGTLAVANYSPELRKRTRVLVAKNALSRALSTLPKSYSRADKKDCLRVMSSLPLIPLGFGCYALGALKGKAEVVSEVSQSRMIFDKRRKIIGLLCCRNAMEYLPDYLANLGSKVDGIVALDDGSTDGSLECLRKSSFVLEVISKPSVEPHVWDEPGNQNLVIKTALKYKPDWLFALDADERVEKNFRLLAELAIDKAERDSFDCCDLHTLELWNSFDTFRVDGIWGKKFKARLFRAEPPIDGIQADFHGQWAANCFGANYKSLASEIKIYHLAMIDEKKRKERLSRYKALDPESKFQAFGYDYLIDEKGISLQRVVSGREYLC